MIKSPIFLIKFKYFSGGNFINFISNYDIPEDWAAFYVAEIILAVDTIHQLEFAHRDLK